MRRGARLIGLALAVAAVSLALGGCVPGRSQPTPIVVMLTPSPAPPSTPAPTATPEPTPIETPTEVPSPTESPAPTAPIVHAMPASFCTGTSHNQAFWAEAASKVSWDVYCLVLPSGWILKTGSYATGAGGKITTTYKGPSGAILELNEGNFCFGAADICGPSATTVGPVFLADLPATLVTLPGGGNAIYVAPGTTRAYLLSGTGISQQTLLSFAAALSKVSRS
jgi:hypothetical protein